ncbi:MAG: hypothetical protein WD738_18665 [Pirellulales bacterium]
MMPSSLVECKEPEDNADTAVFELYDYESDTGETENLATEQPEVVVELHAILDRESEAKPPLRSGPAAKRASARKRRAS